MNNNVPPRIQQKLTVFYNEVLEELVKSQARDYHELLMLWQELHKIYLETTTKALQRWAEKFTPANSGQTDLLDKIEADSISVEVIDKSTGKLFRRDLPISYIETDNGLLLSGETITGTPSQIAFFSEQGIAKINELCGKGPDSSRCHD